MTSSARFRLSGSGGLKRFVFDDEVAAFNPATWDTHLLHRSAGVVLDVLARGPASLAALEQALAAVPGDRELAASLVAELEAAGLIEAEPVDAPR
ncbi:MAG TPA: HPr-rel-A system PqqD family peptide chaperone [Casimicrobiaceae bacterium]|jgi:PqqD family protein of HPr-rel-A system|nr:HPr-rel-A system PqqD family peptide chaperone [Casimicrobiaceae bacterium]